MSAAPLRCVVDATVAIKLSVSEPGSELAERLFTELVSELPAEIHVPDLFYVECTNILWKYVRSSHYSSVTADQDVADLLRLALHSTPTFDLVTDALKIATAHDAC